MLTFFEEVAQGFTNSLITTFYCVDTGINYVILKYQFLCAVLLHAM